MEIRRALLWLTVVALIAAQALGLMHGVTHKPHGVTHSPHGGAHGLHARQSPGMHADTGERGHGWVMRLFAGHDEDSTCRLFDQLGHGDAVPAVPAIELPLVPAAFLLLFFQGEVLARWVALFDARGPPSVR